MLAGLMVAACGRLPSDAQMQEWRALASARDAGAEQALLDAAERGVTLAARLWGELLAQRSDTSSLLEARKWLEQAARQGDARAALALGKLLFKGSAGVPADVQAALPWLQSAFSSGQNAAAHYLALAERQAGRHEAARRWMLTASRAGYADSQFLLAQMLIHGEGGAVDMPQAREWLEAAAEQEHPEAIQQILMARRQGQLGYSPDPQAERQLWLEVQHSLKHRPAAP